jgi:hypothetical protein
MWVFHIMIMIRTRKDDVRVMTNTTAIPVRKKYSLASMVILLKIPIEAAKGMGETSLNYAIMFQQFYNHIIKLKGCNVSPTIRV